MLFSCSPLHGKRGHWGVRLCGVSRGAPFGQARRHAALLPFVTSHPAPIVLRRSRFSDRELLLHVFRGALPDLPQVPAHPTGGGGTASPSAKRTLDGDPSSSDPRRPPARRTFDGNQTCRRGRASRGSQLPHRTPSAWALFRPTLGLLWPIRMVLERRESQAMFLIFPLGYVADLQLPFPWSYRLP